MVARAPIDIGAFIYSDPSLRGGMPCIAGTGMSVHAVVARYRQGQSAEETAVDVPGIPLSHIHPALAYYPANGGVRFVTVSREEVLKLSVAERLQLIGDIWESIEAESDVLPLTDAQREELDRRIEDLERNPSDTLSWEEVRARLERER